MLILASGSPRRAEMLERLGIEFEKRIFDGDESHPADITPDRLVCLLSKRKAEGVCIGKGEIVLSADTVVSIDGKILEKPKSRQEAIEMLSALSGRGHTVYTAFTLKNGEKSLTRLCATRVVFRKLTLGEIIGYIDTGEYKDKAGGYGIQGFGCTLVDRIEGDYSNVVGLPLGQVLCCLRDEFGYDVMKKYEKR